MTNREIAGKLSLLVKQERKLINEILALISTALERRAYLELGYSSMFDWLVRGFGYSNAAAYRRIEAARLIKAVPEISRKLETGQVNLTTVSKAQSIFKAHEKISGREISLAIKADVVRQIENKSAQEAQQILLRVFPEAAPTVHQERKVVVNENTVRLSTNISAGFNADIKRAKELLSHKFPRASDAIILAHVLKVFLDSVDPLRKKSKVGVSTSTVAGREGRCAVSPVGPGQPCPPTASAAEAKCVKSTMRQASRLPDREKPHNSAGTRRMVLKAAAGRCTFKDLITGQVCGSRYQVQIDHIIPRAKNGSDAPSNLRVLCREHNIYEAEIKLGKQMMDRYRTR